MEEELKKFNETGKACFNCKDFLKCEKVKTSGGLACEDHKVLEETKSDGK